MNARGAGARFLDERNRAFRELLGRRKRIVIAGVSGSGKTTLSSLVTDRQVVHTDHYMHEDWDAVPALVALDVAPTGPCVIEGVRALGVTRELGHPVECVVWLDRPLKDLTPRQEAMAAGRRTNFAKWRRENPDVEVVRL